jgi:hypothetical protein
MTFVVGDHVKFDPKLLPSGIPPWGNGAWRIAALDRNVPGQGGAVFARLENDTGQVHDGITTAQLVLAS